jgi:hypothetical protein
MTSRKAGDALEIGEALWARDIAAPDIQAALAANRKHMKRWRANSFTNLP